MSSNGPVPSQRPAGTPSPGGPSSLLVLLQLGEASGQGLSLSRLGNHSLREFPVPAVLLRGSPPGFPECSLGGFQSFHGRAGEVIARPPPVRRTCGAT